MTNCDKIRTSFSDATWAFIADHQRDDVRSLALQVKKYPEVDMPFALNQIAGWQIACTKLPSWARQERIVYPPHISMEQCSSEPTALYKASLAKRLLEGLDSNSLSDASSSAASNPSSFADLTGGFGVDFSYMAPVFDKATYVERQKELCKVARNNFPLLGLDHVQVENEDAIAFLKQLSHVSLLFLDPARRDDKGGKTVFISDCIPDVLSIEEELLQKASYVLLKLSPMLDWHKAVEDLNKVGPVVREVHIVSVKNECKELLLVLHSLDEKGQNSQLNDDLQLFCVNDEQVLHFSLSSLENASSHLLTSALSASTYLYEPNASLMKAGCFALLTELYPVSALGSNSHLFVSTTLIDSFPGRKFSIQAISSFNKKEIKRALAGMKQANLAVRNFPLSVSDLRKRLKISEGGNDYLFATTLNDDSHVLLLCQKA